MAELLQALQAQADALKADLDASSTPEAKAAFMADWKAAHPLLNPVMGTPIAGSYTGNPEHEFQTALNDKQQRYQAVLNAIASEQKNQAPNKEPARTPQQVAEDAAKAQGAQTTANTAKQQAEERNNPDHPGLTNKEAKDADLAGQRLSSEEASRNLTLGIESINAQYRLAMQNGQNQEKALEDAKFQYQKLKDSLDAKVAANDKAVAAQLAQQKLDSERRAQDITQRGQDTSALDSLTKTYASDLAPAGALGDMNEYLKAAATPGYKPNITGTVGANPYDPAALAARALQTYAPAHIQQAGQAIAAQALQTIQNPTTMTAPGPAAPPPVAVAPNGLYPTVNPGNAVLTAPGPG